MKGIFWNCILGIFLLAVVTAVSLHMGQLDEAAGVFSGEGSLIQGIWTIFSLDGGKGRFGAGGRDEAARAVVVLDAGHGGVDPGKVGVDGQLEKEINLAIVVKLKAYLEANNIQVILTRENDNGLYRSGDKNKKSSDMKKRIEIINGAGADVMVSIHQNSYHQPGIAGAQVFYYQSSQEGKKFAQIMQKRFDYCLGDKNTRQAKANGNYYLLSHSKPVSIIVEAGFLSNAEEAAKLETREYQDKIAWTVAMGIIQYLNQKETRRA